MRSINACALLLLALLTVPRIAHAAQSYDNCNGFITSLPAVITTQGTWCLKQDLATSVTSGIAITINANNVTIDCNDFKIGGLSAGSDTTTWGIVADGRSNLTVRHCNIRGFYVGLSFGGSSGGGHVIEDNHFEGNTDWGMFILGDGSVVRRNRIFDTGQSTVEFNPQGIGTYGSVDVLDNTVSGVVVLSGHDGTAYGIFTQANTGGRLMRNGVRGLINGGTGASIAIRSYLSDRVIMRDNDVQSSNGFSSVGLYCDNSFSRAKDNVISGFASPYFNCGDAGRNNIVPQDAF